MMKALVIMLLLAVIAGGAFLSMHEIAPQIQTVEKVLPNDRFIK